VIRTVAAPPLTAELEAQLLEVWLATTNAGGAVGLLAPADAESAREVAQRTWQRVRSGDDALVVLYDTSIPLGWVTLAASASPLEQHWRTVRRLQVHPAHQGHGYGGQLLDAAEEHARELGLEALHLTVRGGTGTERFYLRRGYELVGVIPAALRVAPGDVRDQLYLVKSL
jgi:GNAT superfamily N-acetyltransferase